jgi:hypothetical protein
VRILGNGRAVHDRCLVSGVLVALAALCAALPAAAEHKPLEVGAFNVTHELVLPGAPEVIYDAITGDLSGWWDHSFSDEPASFVLEPTPGGGFWEIFDDSGDGVRHATVIFAERGKWLRFEGPLGFSGKAVHIVYTYKFTPVGEDSTRLNLDVRAAGEIEEGWAETMDAVWHHFLFERFKPYVEAGKHLKKGE